MRVPIEWLKELVDFHLDTEELCVRLTMLGLEVEALDRTEDGDIIEVNVTPNRPDCLSILGLAREISALTGLSLALPDISVKENDKCNIDIEITDDELCWRYAGRVIKDVQIKDSPEWMKKRLERCGMRAVNNVVDATNYVMLEMGHPLHAFDLNEIRRNRIRVARSWKGSRITTLDGLERRLPDDTLLIWDSERPLAIAGIMGGIEASVDENSKSLFLESAYFLPESVRKTSRSMSLKTESSYRFERGTDIEASEKALDRAAALIADLTGGRISKKTDVYPRPSVLPKIKVRYEKINRILGTTISKDEMTDITARLGIRTAKAEDFFIATPPSFRTDLRREVDVIEEIARYYGYDRIPVTIPETAISKEVRDKKYSHILSIRETFRKSGFTEAINYSFMNEPVLDLFRISEEDSRRKTVLLKNPINTEESCLRTFIIPSLIQNLAYNVSMGSKSVRLFEVSRVFRNTGATLPDESHHLGAVWLRDRQPALWKEETPGFYLIKGIIEAMLAEMKICDYRFERSAEPFLHPGQSCDIMVSGRKIGFLGVLHPDITEKLALKVSHPEILALELNIDSLAISTQESAKLAPLPRYPHIDRDIAIIVEDSLPASAILEQIKAYSSELIEDVSVFDFYKGKNIPEGEKSLAFSVRYRAADRTLTDSEIETVHNSLLAFLTEKTGGIMRDKGGLK